MLAERIASGYDDGIVSDRLRAALLDLALLLVPYVGLALAFRDDVPPPIVVAYAAGAFTYRVLLEGTSGQTVGKLLCRLQVVDAEGRPPGMVKAFLRTLVRAFEANPLVLLGLPAIVLLLRSKTRQHLGDKLARTYVLRTSDLPSLSRP